MSLLTLNPPPGFYPEAQSVTVTAANSNLRILWSDTSADPLFVRTVASSSKTGEERPYVQVIDDGLGPVIMDGAFSKYYNGRKDTTFDPPTAKYFTNAMKYLNRKGATNGSKKALLIGDASMSDNGGLGSYSVKSTTTTGFATYLPYLFASAGYTLTIRDRDDYPGNELNPTLAELNGYDVIFFVGSRVNVSLPAAIGKLFAAVRKNRVGMYLCTDHGTDDELGYYIGVNSVLKEITDAKFFGQYDFSPGTTVGYNKALYGDHPLFEGMDDSEVISGSTSDSNVVQSVPAPLVLPQTVPVNKAYTTLKFAVQNISTGEVTSESHNYYVNAEPIFTILHSNGQPIDAYPATTFATRQFRLQRKKQWFDPAEGDELISGFVRVGDVTVASYEEYLVGTTDDEGIPRQFANQQYTVLNTAFTTAGMPVGGFTITMPYWLNEPITVTLGAPFNAEQTWAFNRTVTALNTLTRFSKTLTEIEKALPKLRQQKKLADKIKLMRDAGFITGPVNNWPLLWKEVVEKMQTTTDSYPTLV